MTTIHQPAECSIPDCYCHHASRQDAPLVQLPLEHEPLRSPKQAHDETYARGYQDGWDDCNAMRLRAENDDLRAYRQMVADRMEGR